MASKNVWFSHNRRFKFLPVNFRYHQTSIRKSKRLTHLFNPWLLGSKICLWISRSVLKWQGKKLVALLKKITLVIVFVTALVITHHSTVALRISSTLAYYHTQDSDQDHICWIRTRAIEITPNFLRLEKDINGQIYVYKIIMIISICKIEDLHQYFSSSFSFIFWVVNYASW